MCERIRGQDFNQINNNKNKILNLVDFIQKSVKTGKSENIKANSDTINNTKISPNNKEFQIIYNKIAQSNKQSQYKITVDEEEKNTCENVDCQIPEIDNIYNVTSNEIAFITNDGSNKIEQENNYNLNTNLSNLLIQPNEAEEIIKKSIITIINALNLNVYDGINTINLKNPSNEILDQIAEILSVLKKIAGLFEESVVNNKPIEYGNFKLDISQAQKLEKTIREQVFKIELCLKMLGLSKEIFSRISEKEKTFEFNGIIAAKNPSEINMPVTYVNQIFGKKIIFSQEKLQLLFYELVKVLKTKETPNTFGLVKKITEIATDNFGAKSDYDNLNVLDIKVIRKLLNIDVSQNIKALADQNTQAASQNEKMDIPQALKGSIVKTILQESQNFKSEEKALFSSENIKIQNASTNLHNINVIDNIFPKNLEESVINRILEKVNSALKNGITEMRIMLKPESLGEVHLKIRLEGDVVMAKIYVENQHVKHIVESNMGALKDALIQHNLQMGNVDVEINHNNENNQGQMQAMADMNDNKTQYNRNTSQSEKSEEDEINDYEIRIGQETGRRFGNNTIEYFA
jgi:hypothetical protein